MSNNKTFKALVVQETSDGEFKKASKPVTSAIYLRTIC